MRKILILSNDHAYTYDLRKEIIEELLKSYEVYVAVPYGDKVALLEEMGCKHIDVELEKRGKNPFHDLKLLKKYGCIMKNLRPDMVLSYTIKPNVYGGIMAKKYQIPQIANITGLGTAIENEGLMQKFTVFLHRIAFHKVSCVFFQNEENMEFFRKKKICNATYKLLPGSGVNTTEYEYLKYPTDTNSIDFLFISRIIKEKGIEEYLYAAKYVKAKYPNVHFHILGNCDETYRTILDEAEKEGVVEYHGRTDNVIPYIENCHCLIHPSYYPEGMSNVCLEAAASGRPVITTNRSGCRETVDDGVTGYIVETRNKEQLIQAIEHFVELPLEQKIQMGKAGRKKMVEIFERRKIVDAYMEQVEEILN